MFALKPDYELCKARIDAFWERELIDRPVVQFGLAKAPAERIPLPLSTHATPAERWLDTEYQTALAVASLGNRHFLGDTMPVAYPNLGPEVFSAFYGCPLHFGDYGTSWSSPILHDWADADSLGLDWAHPYLYKLLEMTDSLLAAGEDQFIVGMPDWHPGGDCIAAFRDPMNLAFDMHDNPAAVQALLPRVTADYFQLYDLFYAKLRAAGQPISTWLPLVSDDKYYVPSNDFSIMISTPMFEELFVPGLIEECRFLERTIYHLDGPGALRHLETILAIPELDGLQFVPGAGNEGYARWVEVYRRAQAADKAIQVFCTFGEIEQVAETLDPHGVFLQVSDVPSVAAAQAMLARLERWAAEGV